MKRRRNSGTELLLSFLHLVSICSRSTSADCLDPARSPFSQIVFLTRFRELSDGDAKRLSCRSGKFVRRSFTFLAGSLLKTLDLNKYQRGDSSAVAIACYLNEKPCSTDLLCELCAGSSII
jgi:hypothetical protein